jgi:hypothetical protein
LISCLVRQLAEVPRELGEIGPPVGVLADGLPGVAVIIGSALSFGLNLCHCGEE